MAQAELLGGPYSAPPCRLDEWLNDEISGLVQVGGWTDAPIPWPRRKKTGKHSPILCGDLVQAVRIESSEAIQHHWGIGIVTVWKWRQALGVGRATDGTRKLLRERTGVPPEASARGRAKAATPEIRAKMAQTKRKPYAKFDIPIAYRPWSEKELRFARRWRSQLTYAEISAILHRSEGAVGQRVAKFGAYKLEPWTPEEDAIVLGWPENRPINELSGQLNRAMQSIYERRRYLGIAKPNSRTKKRNDI